MKDNWCCYLLRLFLTSTQSRPPSRISRVTEKSRLLSACLKLLEADSCHCQSPGGWVPKAEQPGQMGWLLVEAWGITKCYHCVWHLTATVVITALREGRALDHTKQLLDLMLLQKRQCILKSCRMSPDRWCHLKYICDSCQKLQITQ